MSARVAVWTTWPLPEPGVDMWDWQDGRCAWCGWRDPIRRLAEDHCHFTGLVRGYLCTGCNVHEGTSPDPAWDEWREGDNPANALKEFRIYRNHMRGTPITSAGALHWYTHDERAAWFELVVQHLEAGGEWPTDAPWIDTAVERKAALMAEANAAITRLFDEHGISFTPKEAAS